MDCTDYGWIIIFNSCFKRLSGAVHTGFFFFCNLLFNCVSGVTDVVLMMTKLGCTQPLSETGTHVLWARILLALLSRKSVLMANIIIFFAWEQINHASRQYFILRRADCIPRSCGCAVNTPPWPLIKLSPVPGDRLQFVCLLSLHSPLTPNPQHPLACSSRQVFSLLPFFHLLHSHVSY